jgi:nucleotide-binding universal stress UspA family protein
MEPAVFSTVIVGYDGSVQAQDALALGQDLCEREGGMLMPVCAFPSDPHLDHRSAVTAPPGVALRAAEEALQQARAQLDGTLLVETRAVQSSSVPRALTELAEDEAADLVVVGSTAGEHRFGDVATRLLHGSPCAVAVAPPGYRGRRGIHRVGVAYDGSPEAELALDAAYRIATLRHAAVTIYSVATAPGSEQARDRLTDAALRAPAPLVPDAELLEGPPVETITLAAAVAVDVLVMGSRGYGPVRRAVLGSVSAGLVHASAVPVIVTPRGAARHRAGARPGRLAVTVA